MARNRRIDAEQTVYRGRAHLAEPPFGTIEQAMGLRKFHRHGLMAVQGEWLLATMAANSQDSHASGSANPRNLSSAVTFAPRRRCRLTGNSDAGSQMSSSHKDPQSVPVGADHQRSSGAMFQR
jgi:hypothetical protein